jgi:branched-chain amino acid transport system permease protein
MAGAFALAYAGERDWPIGVGIALCFAVVLALSLAMERVVFRPLRTQSAAVMLIATFAIAFLLQSIALLWFGPLGKTATSLVQLNRPVEVAGVDIRKIAIVAIVTAVVCLVLLVTLLNRTSIGLHMRASAMDSQTARLLGVRANFVSTVSVLIAGALAAVVAVLLTVQYPTVTPTFALQETILVLAGVVVGGMTRLLSATLGGFLIGYASGLLGGALPSSQSQYLPSFIFGLVILVLLLRPDGLFTRGRGLVERV